MDGKMCTEDESIRLAIEQATRDAPQGQRSPVRWSRGSNAVIVISDDDGANYSNRRWLTSYGLENVKAGARTSCPGPKSEIRMASAEFGYGSFQIDHIFKQESANDIHFATTHLCLKSASQPFLETLSGEEYEAFCRKASLHIDSDHVYRDVHKITFLMRTLGIRHVEHPHDTDDCDPESSVEWKNKSVRWRNLPSMVAVARNGHYDFFFSKVPETRVFKTADDIPTTQECAFTEPDLPVHAFDSVMEQTARLGVALRDEVAYSSIQLALAKRWPCHIFAFELPGHRANGVVAGFFFVWQSPDFELVPQVGERFSVQLDGIPFQPRRSPNTVSPQEGRKIITDHIFEAYVDAGVTAGKDARVFHKSVVDALDLVIKPSKDSKERNTWLEGQAIKLSPKSGNRKTRAEAGCMPTENPVEHRDRIAKWVDGVFARGGLRLSDEVLNRCPHLNAVRVTVPSWMEPLGVIGAYVRSPLIPGWPKHKKPVSVVEYTIPIIKITSNLAETIGKVRCKRAKFVFNSRFVRTAHGGQLKAGLRALSLSGRDTWEASGSNDAAFSRYIAKVSGDIISYDLTAALPLLREFLDHVESNTTPSDPVLRVALGIYHKLDSDQKALFARVKSLPFGTEILSGAPGSGKNYTCQLLMAIIQHSHVNQDVVRTWAKSTATAPASQNDTGAVLPTTDPYAPEEPTLSDESHAQLLIVVPSNDMLDKIAEDMRALYLTLGLQKRLCRVQTPDNATKNMTSPLNPDDGSAQYDKQQGDECGEALEAEVYLRTLSKDCFDNHRTVAALGGEFAVSTLVAKRIEDAAPDDELVSGVSDLQKLRSNEPETFYHEHFGKLQKLLRKACDEEYLRADVLLSTPEAFYKLAVREVKLRIIAVWQDEAFRLTEPEALIALQFTKPFVRLMTGDDKQCQPIVKSLYAHKNNNKDLVFCAQFGEQLQLSLPSRMIKAGFQAHYLNINHRACEGVSAFPSQQYYGGKMTEARREVLRVQERVKEFFRALTGDRCTRGTALVVNLSGDNERKVGTSFTNSTSIAVILEILRLIYRVNMICDKLPTTQKDGELISVLIIFPYKAQMMLFRRELAKLWPSDLPFHKIKSGCVPSIQGGEAELVIFDGVRDASPGFTGSSELQNTALTRAIFGYIAIQSDELWTRQHPGGLHQKDSRVRNIVALDQYCSDRDAIVQLHGPLDIDDVTFPGKDREETMSSLVKAGTHLPEKLRGFQWIKYEKLSLARLRSKLP